MPVRNRATAWVPSVRTDMTLETRRTAASPVPVRSAPAHDAIVVVPSPVLNEVVPSEAASLFESSEAPPLDPSLEATKAALPQLTEAEIRRMPLKLSGEAQVKGTSPKYDLEGTAPDGTVHAFIFESDTEGKAIYQRERFAQGLREKLGWPTLVTVPYQLTLPDGKTLQGYIKPRATTTGSLSNDPRQWTATQIQSVLREGPALEASANYDAKPAQSIVIQRPGREDDAVNIDQDRSMDAALFNQPLTRFKNRKKPTLQPYPVSPSAQSLAYKAYVHGEIDADLSVVRQAAYDIAAIPDAEYAKDLRAFAQAYFAHNTACGPYTSVEHFVAAGVENKNDLPREFDALVDRLEDERRRYAAGERPDKATRREDRRLEKAVSFMESPLYDFKNKVHRIFSGIIGR